MKKGNSRKHVAREWMNGLTRVSTSSMALFAFAAVNYSTKSEMDMSGAKKLADEITTTTRRGRESCPFWTDLETVQGSGNPLEPGVTGYDV